METKKTHQYDKYLLIVTFTLLAISILMVFSTTAVISREHYGNSLSMIKKHLFHVFLGLGAFGFFSKLNPKVLKNLAIPAMILAFCLLALVLVPSIGHTAGGARRWLNLGFIRLQPGEICKMLLIVYFAAYVEANWNKMSGLLPGAIIPFGVMAMFGALLLKEPDFGTTAVLGIVVFGQLFVASRITHLIGIGVIGVISAAMLILHSPYRMRRLLAFMDPYSSASTSGYQLIQSLIAVGSGGLLGEGLGLGKQKLFYLPAAHTDFIFAVIAEELGLVGAVFVLLLFLTILFRGIKIARDLSHRPFCCSLAIGCTLMLVVPALLNIGVVTGLLPTKGLVLPLIAYGGTAMIVHLAAMGVLIRLSAERQLT